MRKVLRLVFAELNLIISGIYSRQWNSGTPRMVVKAEQERIRTLIRDTITLLCRNGLTYKTQFSIEALIGITLDEGDVFLVSINENIKPTLDCYNESSNESGQDWDENRSYNDGYSHGCSSNRKRRRRAWSQIKSENVNSDKEDSSRATANNLLDLSITSYETSKAPKQERTEKGSCNQKPSEGEQSGNSSKGGNLGDGAEDRQSIEDEEEKTSKQAVIVKKEYLDESWPPAGIIQEVTVGGSDANCETSYPSQSVQSTMTSSSGLQHPTSSVVSLNSSLRTHQAIAGLPLVNGMPFPALPLPQSHFAQALGRLVGSMPPSLSQHISGSRDLTSKSAGHSTAGPTSNVYQPTSRSSLPKEAVALMTDWLRKNQHNPYPTDDIKDEFVRMTNLTYNQINYWFTNARRRLLPKWELQRKIEAQQLAERLSQGTQQVRNDLPTWMAPEGEESTSTTKS